jgi:hypothetical protein
MVASLVRSPHPYQSRLHAGAGRGRDTHITPKAYRIRSVIVGNLTAATN